MREQLAVGQLQLHEDEWVGAGDGVLGTAQVILERLTLVPAELALPGAPRGFLAQRKDVVAKRGNGKLRTLIRQLGGRANHGKCSWE